MRVVIAGQKRFGADTLALVLARGWEVAAVSCPPDDALGHAAQRHRLPIIGSKDFCAQTMPGGCDLIVAAHCHCYLSSKTRNRAELGALGYHPSLLPRHRGRSAVEWAIRMREPITGGTVSWFNDTVDGGPIAAQESVHIRSDDTPRTLWARDLAPLGLRLFRRVFDYLDKGILPATSQDPALATWEPAIDGVPPLWRPDCIMLGSSRWQVRAEAE
jgi:methionyl-tRNA formyltransferase